MAIATIFEGEASLHSSTASRLALIQIGLVRDSQFEVVTKHCGSRFYRFRAALQHADRLKKNRVHEMQTFVSIGARRVKFCALHLYEVLCDLNSVYCRRDVLSAKISQWYQIAKFTRFKFRHFREFGSYFHKYCWALINGQRSSHIQLDRLNRANGHADSCVHSGRAYSRRTQLGVAFLALVGGRNIESNDYCATRSNRCCDVPEVFRRAGNTCNDGPYPKYGQKSNCDEQPDERQLRDFPRALHAYPDLDFLGIVARREEMARVRAVA